ncbi:hypothetical protein ACFY5D_21460 [Paeniglutamicibacter sp. NPDC012692]|uniref:hypothetical protein n=1 Tax=Paeniglutamicibacter sp. NPDC012692 TaxID=3364388 RepID=UPI0036CA08EF
MENHPGDDSWVITRVRGDLFELRNTSPHARVDVRVQLRGGGAVGGESHWRKGYSLIGPAEAVQFIFLHSSRLQTDPSYLEVRYREIRDEGGVEGIARVDFP